MVKSQAFQLLLGTAFVSSFVSCMLYYHQTKIEVARSIRRVNDSDLHVNLGKLLEASGLSHIRSTLNDLGYPMTIRVSSQDSSHHYAVSRKSRNKKLPQPNSDGTLQRYPFDAGKSTLDKTNSTLNTTDKLGNTVNNSSDNDASSFDPEASFDFDMTDNDYEHSNDLYDAESILGQWWLDHHKHKDLDVQETSQAMELLLDWQKQTRQEDNQRETNIDPITLLNKWHEIIRPHEVEENSLDPAAVSEDLKQVLVQWESEVLHDKDLHIYDRKEAVDLLLEWKKEKQDGIHSALPEGASEQTDTSKINQFELLNEWHDQKLNEYAVVNQNDGSVNMDKAYSDESKDPNRNEILGFLKDWTERKKYLDDNWDTNDLQRDSKGIEVETISSKSEGTLGGQRDSFIQQVLGKNAAGSSVQSDVTNTAVDNFLNEWLTIRQKQETGIQLTNTIDQTNIHSQVLNTGAADTGQSIETQESVPRIPFVQDRVLPENQLKSLMYASNMEIAEANIQKPKFGTYQVSDGNQQNPNQQMINASPQPISQGANYPQLYHQQSPALIQSLSYPQQDIHQEVQIGHQQPLHLSRESTEVHKIIQTDQSKQFIATERTGTMMQKVPPQQQQQQLHQQQEPTQQQQQQQQESPQNQQQESYQQQGPHPPQQQQQQEPYQQQEPHPPQQQQQEPHQQQHQQEPSQLQQQTLLNYQHQSTMQQNRNLPLQLPTLQVLQEHQAEITERKQVHQELLEQQLNSQIASQNKAAPDHLKVTQELPKPTMSTYQSIEEQLAPRPLPLSKDTPIQQQVAFMDPEEAEKYVFTTLGEAEEAVRKQDKEVVTLMMNNRDSQPTKEPMPMNHPQIGELSLGELAEVSKENDAKAAKVIKFQSSFVDKDLEGLKANSEIESGLSGKHHAHHPPIRPPRQLKPSAPEHPKKTSRNTNVLFYAYLRGGSSIGSEVFNRDPHTFFWYEPLDAFYSAYFGIPQQTLPGDILYTNNITQRVFLFEERRWLVNFFRNLYECKLKELPPDLFAHDFRHKSDNLHGFTSCYTDVKDRVILDMCRKFTVPVCGKTVDDSIGQQCHVVMEAARRIKDRIPTRESSNFEVKEVEMRRYVGMLDSEINEMRVKRTGGAMDNLKNFVSHQICVNAISAQISKCLPRAIDVCRNSALHVAKVLRLRFEDIDELTYLYPELKVIYFPRDPRAIAYSRAQTDMLKNKRNPHYVEEARYTCMRMRSDLNKKDILEKHYPGKIFTIKYETLARDIVGYAQQVYNFLDKPVPSQWKEFISRSSQEKDGQDDPFSLIRQHPMKTAILWKRKTIGSARNNMYDKCKSVLEDLGYEP